MLKLSPPAFSFLRIGFNPVFLGTPGYYLTVGSDGKLAQAASTTAGAMPSGTVSAPGLAFASELGTGFYHPSANTISVAVNGTDVLGLTTTTATFATPVAVPDGTYPNMGEMNANAQMTQCFYPTGNYTGGTGIGTPDLGFLGANLFYRNQQIIWFNKAQTNVLSEYDRGAIMNVVAGMPGYRGIAGQYRSQNYSADGDFRTDASMYCRVYSASAYDFSVPSISTTTATLANLYFDPAVDKMLTPAMAIGDVNILIHSNGGVGLASGTKITGITSGTTATIILNNACSSAPLTTQDFSMKVTAPAANGTLHSDWLSYFHKPFVADVANSGPGGVAVLSNLKFNPLRVGLQTTATIDNPGKIPASSRVINYSAIGTSYAIQMGDSITGQPVLGLAAATATSCTLETNNGTLTVTGAISTTSSWITALSIDPIARSITTDGTAGWDRPQWNPTSFVFSSGATVNGVTSTSITLNSVALLNETNFASKIEMSKTAWVFDAINGARLRVMEAGWLPAVADYGFMIENNIPMYQGTQKLIDGPSGAWVGIITSASATLTSLSLTSFTKVAGHTYQTAAISSNVLAIDLSTGDVFKTTVNADINTFTISNPPASKFSSFRLVLTANGTGFVQNWNSSGTVHGPSGTFPTLTTTNGKKDILDFSTDDGGSNWYLAVYGQAY